VICQGGGRTLHTLADFSGPTARVPAPNAFNPIDPNSTCSPRAILFQTYNRDMAALEAIYRWRQQPEIVEVKPEESSEEEKEEMTKYMRSSPKPEIVEEVAVLTNIRATEIHTDSGQLNTKRRYSTGLESDFEEVLVKEEEVDEEDEKEEEMVSRPSSTEMMAVPLKKRARMMEVPYAIGHVINKCVTPVMPFTFEEEFQVIDYIVRIEQYQNKRFEFLTKNFQMYRELTVAFVACTAQKKKIPFNRDLEKKLFGMGLEFTKQNTTEVYEEMASLSVNTRKEMLNSTYPALYVVMFSILEGNTREPSWIEQHKKTIHITKENHRSVQGYIAGLENVRAISLKDQERFSSPWAVEMADEEKFERTIAILGRILRDDLQLQALYHMLVMMTPSPRAPAEVQSDPILIKVQVKLCQLIYRYLSNASLEAPPSPTSDGPEPGSAIMRLACHEESSGLSPDEKTRLLISMLDTLHDCAEIMLYRSLSLDG